MRKLLIFALFGYVTGISAMEILDCRFIQIPEHYNLFSLYAHYVTDVQGIDLAAGASCILTMNGSESIAKTSGPLQYTQLNATQYRITHLEHQKAVIYINDSGSSSALGAPYMNASSGRSVFVIDSTWTDPDDVLWSLYQNEDANEG